MPIEDCYIGNEECEEESVNACGTGFVLDVFGNCQELPCPGDPVPNPQIASQTNSGIPGGMYGCTRNGSGCEGELNKKYHGGNRLKS